MLILTIECRIYGSNIIEYNNINELINFSKYNDIIWLKLENVIFNDKFYFPKKLQQLFVNNCKNFNDFGYLSEDIMFVEITNCYLTTLTNLFDKSIIINNLETLNVSYNRLTEVPKHLPKSLISLNLSNNDITKLPDTNIFPKDIQHINLSFNKLSELPECILELNENTTLLLMPNKFWFNSYSNISLNREIKEYHILIAHRFFDLFLANKLIKTRNIINNTEPGLNGDVTRAYMNEMLARGLTVNIVTVDRRAVNNLVSNSVKKNNIKTTAEQGQNVHNSDIQDSFSKSIDNIMKHKAPKDSKYLDSVYYYYLFDGFDIIKNLRVYYIIKHNCRIQTFVSRNGVTYSELFERIWAIIKIHKDCTELRKILKDEIIQGRGLCFTGQVTRIVNALCGFIDGIHIGYSENEQINNAVIATMRRCENDTKLNVKEEVKKALDELKVPEDKQMVWLEALED
jgi:hypothetical protein